MPGSAFASREMTHMMENILYNELIVREYSVDVGVVLFQKKTKWDADQSAQRN